MPPVGEPLPVSIGSPAGAAYRIVCCSDGRGFHPAAVVFEPAIGAVPWLSYEVAPDGPVAVKPV
jgi:hypothetical protein